ncbi:HpcH/HpaI aldolase/citrate lyase family protein [Hydrogenophaga pseudoflava]|uniref:HpcH/HpaI aldolase/citrate lyase family protein n=1 Tax=Hydrogenophaga pseudoflava TaxID=47421 RepID=UPI0027E555CE|nr:aldolase/citrate lyase family protein [Hydrogenophaga pseudoflava]MDQ7746828.1 aldolase/citrate lyase family protein [Hydrogenophaga pseudoflava]
MKPHPREILAGAQAGAFALPVCDHYSGVEARMKKSLQLQAELSAEFGACVFDVTLDCEDGAPVGGEAEHAALVTELVLGAPAGARVAARVHPVDHAQFDADVATIAGRAGARLCHLMVPKVESVADVERAVAAMNAAGATALPLHVLIESPAAVHRAFDIAAHPRVASLSFGLMDFVSAHGGAIPASAMTLAGQFSHPHVLRAKVEMAAACHAHGKVPSHNVVTEFRDLAALQNAARQAATELGYTRMWSIHPDQIRTIVTAFSPTEAEIETALAIVERAAAADWAPVQHEGRLHDRASYRYYWQVIERAHQTGHALPETVRGWFLA